MPTISVLLPVYNGGELLKLSVESVFAQTLGDFEFVICDDGSSDDSVAYIESLRDPRVRFLRNPRNRGLFPTLNRLLGESKSPLLHLWSQDDVMRPCCLDRVVEYHRKKPELSMSFSQFELIDGSGVPWAKQCPEDDPAPRIIDPELYAEMSLIWGCLPNNISNVTLTQWGVERFGAFREHFIYAGDFELWTRFAEHGAIARQAERLIQLRVHSSQFSARMPDRVTSIEEILPIFLDLLARCHPDRRAEMARVWRWRVLVTQMRTGIACLLRNRRDLFWRTCKILRPYGSLTGTALRLSLLEALRVVRLQDWFVRRLYLSAHLQRMDKARRAEIAAGR